jgi:hypothetical protein
MEKNVKEVGRQAGTREIVFGARNSRGQTSTSNDKVFVAWEPDSLDF